MRKLFRIAICCLVVCALVVNLSPIRAKAVAAEAAAVSAAIVTCPELVAIAAAMIAIGVMASPSTRDNFVNAANAVAEYLSTSVPELLRVTYEGGQAVYYASVEFLESVRCAMIDAEVLIPPFSSFGAGQSMTMLDGTILVPSSECVYFVVSHTSGTRFTEIFYFPSGGTLYDETRAVYKDLSLVTVNGSRHSYYSITRSGVDYSAYAGIVWPDYTDLNLVRDIISTYLAGAFDIAVAYGLTAGVIPAVPIDGSSALQWSDEYCSRQLRLLTPEGGGAPGDDSGGDSGDNPQGGFVENVLFPLTLLGTVLEIAGLTQQNQWLGDVPSNVPDVEVVTEYEILDAPEVDGFQGIQVSPVPDSAPDSGSGTDPEGGTSSGGDASYTLDLTEYFPFCIPFDIFEFLSLLAADPEAPVFEWVIPVPQMDVEFPIKVDLSAWDGIAKLFRTLELLAFIVGLAMVTRDKFIRG